MSYLAFDPNCRAIRMAGRDHLLRLVLRADGTGLAKLYEVGRDGRVSLLCAAFRNHPSHRWCFGMDTHNASGDTPMEAATAFLRSSLGLPVVRS